MNFIGRHICNVTELFSIQPTFILMISDTGLFQFGLVFVMCVYVCVYLYEDA